MQYTLSRGHQSPYTFQCQPVYSCRPPLPDLGHSVKEMTECMGEKEQEKKKEEENGSLNISH